MGCPLFTNLFGVHPIYGTPQMTPPWCPGAASLIFTDKAVIREIGGKFFFMIQASFQWENPDPKIWSYVSTMFQAIFWGILS